MRYYNMYKNKNLPNKSVDNFLSQLKSLCKKHKLTILPERGSFIIEQFDMKKTVNGFNNVKINIKISDEEESDNN